MTAGAYASTPQTTPGRLRERVSYDRALVHATLDEAILCHVGVVVDERPVVLPQLHARVGDVLYLHGSSGARLLRAGPAGVPVCVTVTCLDGLVLARSALHHSVNYRSVVAHGVAHEVIGEEKDIALRHLVDGIVPGRSDGVRGPSRKELAATTVLRLPLGAVSYKSRTGPPSDDQDDMDLPYWAGVLPIQSYVPGIPQPAPDLTAGIATPAHVRDWTRP